MTPEDYKFLFSQLDNSLIPNGIYDKVMRGEELAPEDEKQIKAIIKEQPREPIEIVGYGMMCPTCKLKYLKMKAIRCERCNQKLLW